MQRHNNYFFKSFALIFILTLLSISPAYSDDNKDENKKRMDAVVVTATRMETPVEETTKSVNIVSSEDREEQQEYWLPDLLDNQPGIFIRNLGGVGQWSHISIRGAGSQHTLFQYNGMPLRDAADTQGTLTYFIEDLYSGSNLNRVEVLKGTSSTLHGTQAMGGVINVIPEKWQEGLSAELRNELGPNSTYIGNAKIAYGNERYYFNINPMYVTSDGENYGGPDGFYYDNEGLTLGAGVGPTDSTTLEINMIYSDSDVATTGSTPSLDDLGNLIIQQADPTQHREGLMYQFGITWGHEVTEKWDYTIKGSTSKTERHYFWSAVSGDQSNYDGKTRYIELQNNLYVNDWLTLNIGGNYEKDIYDGEEPNDPNSGDYSRVYYDEEWGNYDIFSQAQLTLLDKSLFFTVGGRYNDHDNFDDETVWEISGAYIIKSTNTKFHAHAGSGYRTPSLFEIYGGYVYGGVLYDIGNPDLIPEKSKGYEFGIDQSFIDNKVKAGATYFFTEFEDLISYTNFSYYNANEAESEGVEAYASYNPCTYFKLDLAYTYVSAKSKATSISEWARSNYQPRNKIDIIATMYPMENLTVTADLRWRDQKIVPLSDPFWNTISWEEDSAATMNLAATYKPIDLLDLFVRIENLFDKDYTESGYAMPGLSVYGGMKLSY
ncbi:MAG: TonB-dependent receptor [Desulfobacteraceae bacterium]